MLKVAKFGGSSLADAERVKQVLGIIERDPSVQFIVPSAPGARFEGDPKVTDLLLAFHKGGANGISADATYAMIAERFSEITDGIGLQSDAFEKCLGGPREMLRRKSPDEVASRGEFIMGSILAQALNCRFADPLGLIRFDDTGRYDEAATQARCDTWLGSDNGTDRVVIPGFYGALSNFSIKTFPRGGSDISGAIIAAAVKADLYENWTDVPGVLIADPAIVPAARTIDLLTYSELSELAYMGARVFHGEAVLPLRRLGIPTNIRSARNPNHPGTMVVADAAAPERTHGSIVGIAGRKGFTVITVAKAMMNAEIGFVRRICSVFEEAGVSLEHIPGGIDTLSVIVATDALDGKLDRIRSGIARECDPDTITVANDLAMICMVGQAMAQTPGVAARMLYAVAQHHINVRLINQGSSEVSIIIGVDNRDMERAVRAIYHAFVE